MPKKIAYLSLCFSLLLFTQPLFAADVQTVGDLSVQGVIESTSGGFKFPDGTLLTTGGLNGLLFNVGFVVDDSGSNTGNLNSGGIKFGGEGSGEGIASQRTAGAGQNGLDFYTNSASRLFINNNGYVGVGTRAPAFPLDVRLSRGIYNYARFGVDGGAQPLFLIANPPILGFNAYYESGWKYGGTGSAGYLAFDGSFKFATAPSGTADGSASLTQKMVITNAGNVGIGTLSPAQALDVVGNINASNTLSGFGLRGSEMVVDKGNSNTGAVNLYALTFGLSSGEGIASKRTAGGNQYGLDFYSNFDNRMSITQGGNVGIGTDAPAVKLDVRGDTAVSGVVKAGPGQTGTPLAYGTFAANGTKSAGSANITCAWNSTDLYYDCSLADYFYTTHVASVTVVNAANVNPLIAATSSGGTGILRVRIYNLASATPTTPIQSMFHVVVYKP